MDIAQQISNITSFFENYIKERKDEKMIYIAIVLNEMERKSKQMAKPSAYADGYEEAIDEAKTSLGIKNTIYELYQQTLTKIK